MEDWEKKRLIDESNSKIDEQTIGFYIGPKLNSIGRRK